MAAAAISPPTTDHPSSGPNCRPMAAIGIDTLAWAIAITKASVVARCRLEAPRWSIIASVATGAAKLTKLICTAANTPSPVRPKGRNNGVMRVTTQSSTPRASSRRINDSMTSVTEKQFGEIFRYKNIIILKEETASVGAELKSLFEREKIINPLLIRQSTVKFTSDDDLDSYLIVPENKEGFRQYYNLKSRIDGENITLDSGGAVITQKIADALNVSKGGAVTIKTADNQEYALPVADVAENYISNYIFMDKTLYEAVFGGTVSYNAVVSDNNADETALAANLTQNEAVLNVILTRDVVEKTEENMKSFHSLISLVIVVASLLVFVVLYNLTSINISERTREIATLKVLGFTDLETNSYIYREAFILSMASISVGLTAGVFLHRYVITVVEGFVVFLKQIKWQSFVYSAVLTLIFTLLMVIFTYFKLKTVNMLESLKSIE